LEIEAVMLVVLLFVMLDIGVVEEVIVGIIKVIWKSDPRTFAPAFIFFLPAVP
jgi:hypothetical protein